MYNLNTLGRLLILTSEMCIEQLISWHIYVNDACNSVVIMIKL